MPKSFFLAYWRTILLCVVIFVLSTVSVGTMPAATRIPGSDKAAHLLMYVALGFVACYELAADMVFRPRWRRPFVVVFLLLAFFGGAIEVLQGLCFKPRTAELMDWAADVLGLLIGGWGGKLLTKLRT